MIEVKDFDNFKINDGKILVYPDREEDRMRFGSVKINLDPTYEPYKHAITTGIVMKVPKNTLDPRVEVELKEGDRAFFHYLSYSNAIKDNSCVITDNKRLLKVNYESVFVAQRGEEVIPVNGYVLVEPASSDYPLFVPKGILIPPRLKSSTSAFRGTVRYVGTPLAGEDEFISPGDGIYFRKHSDVPLQYKLHADFKGHQIYWRMKRYNILAVL